MTWYYRRRRRIFFAIIISIFLIFIIAHASLKLKDTFIVISRGRIQTIALKIINDIVSDKIRNLEENNLIIYQKDTNATITAVDINIIAMNKLSNEINTEVVNALDNLKDTYIYIPLGSATGYDLLAATGPMIPVKILPIGDITLDFKTEFLSTGINQTSHKIYLNVVCKMNMVTTFAYEDVEINQKIPIAETVIIGNVPSTYYNFNGIESNNLASMID